MIKKIILEIGGQKIELTLDEARQLRDDLNNLLGEKEIVYRGGPAYVITPFVCPPTINPSIVPPYTITCVT